MKKFKVLVCEKLFEANFVRLFILNVVYEDFNNVLVWRILCKYNWFKHHFYPQYYLQKLCVKIYLTAQGD